jgi:hypothetical protein
MRKNLGEFLLRSRLYCAVMIENDRARAGGTLIESEYVAHGRVKYVIAILRQRRHGGIMALIYGP